MGKNDVSVKRWLSDKERFADLFNGVLFQGAGIISAADLEEADSEVDVMIRDKNGKDRAYQRYRDIVMRWKQSVDFVVLACESQDSVHYAMPVRGMVYDGLTYTRQIEYLWTKQKEHKNISAAEFLSHFRKTDAISPVITLVFYYSQEPWDGNADLYGMFPQELMSWGRDVVERYVPNYRINLIDIARIEDVNVFQGDLQIIFQMIKYMSNKPKLIAYINENKDYFSSVDFDTYQVIRTFLNSEKQLKEWKEKETEGGINMCQALEELYQDGVKEGEARGEARGEAKVWKLNQHLLQDKRYQDLEKASEDNEFRRQLYREYRI
ncbi:MAG: Rpn family recombination-promoting nuclease/putative transposase [Lachnospiraceae bacterium]|nr:Rpn family recombination-promoting nuclease/putative transposase [Lachnospiraceae bacterium]